MEIIETPLDLRFQIFASQEKSSDLRLYQICGSFNTGSK